MAFLGHLLATAAACPVAMSGVSLAVVCDLALALAAR